MKKTKTSIKNYWNWRSKSFGCDIDKSAEVVNRWETILNDLVAGASGKRALDVGTGTGQFALYLAGSGFVVTGIDLAENMIFYAKQNAGKHELDIDFQIGDAERLVFEDNTFDVVVSRNLLWTLPNPQKAIFEWRRVMKPEAILVISDGLWMNYTWKRVHCLALNLFKRMFADSGVISAHFFLSYFGLCKTLPFYEGICFDEVSMLLRTACFKDINSYDTSCFGANPYVGSKPIKNKEPLFFIAHARR
ncbi:MAG: methyltransferase domain-containing protein [Desulfobacteraceae bacterium]|nr:methyltransferase domain-containing protein [Desulfobacteraceae bacterium]MBC2719205.1 methyltransferase domain-containing protein [Desulfobacteraceae bacterium]